MQPFPRHWATVRETHTFPGTGTLDLSINGWSDHSAEDAEREARSRLDRLIAAGGPHRSAWDASEYYPQRRMPEELLDEVHAPDGTLTAAITRNRYGAAVLNTDALLISDIDLPQESRAARPRRRPGLFARLFGGGRSSQSDEPQNSGGGHALSAADAGDPEVSRVLETIREFTDEHPELGVRSYRTRGGFRLLISGTGAGPRSDRARELMEQLRSDALYVMLCRAHDSYRARLTPKPWRIGVDRYEDLGSRTSADAVHRDWVSRYRSASREVAVCRLLAVAGPAASELEQELIDLHDRATLSEAELPLA